MAKLIQKCGYLKAGGGDAYMKYIATREGVEIIEREIPATKKQQELIADLLYDFPDSEELFEYADYLAKPTAGMASAFIAAAIDRNAHTIQDGDIYMKYIATRPRAAKHGTHGLFGAEENIDLSTALHELETHEGNTWTIIYSLRREDAARLDYDNAERWRKLLIQHQAEFADAMKIHPEHFHWYAAFHDEGHHPHIHMMAWSDTPKEGYLSKKAVKALRSLMTNSIFQDEMYQLYTQKDISYKELTAKAQTSMRELIETMQAKVCISPVIEQKMQELVMMLGSARGKKQYGYLPKEAKGIVDSIVDELSKQPEVAACYEAWNKLRDELEGYYKDKPREHLPLSQQKEFRVLKNMVIREAENIRLGVYTFEDEEMPDEPVIHELPKLPSVPLVEQESQPNYGDTHIDYWESKWRQGHPWAAHVLGKLYRDGVEVPQDLQEAERWFWISAEGGNEVSEYAIGKMLLPDHPDSALHWLEESAAHGYDYAMYRLGKLCLVGEIVERDVNTTLEWFTRAAELGNQYAQYALGKLYLQGREIPQDKEKAMRWLESSAAQGNIYAQYLLFRMEEQSNPSIMLAATKLLHHASRIFRQQAAPANPKGISMDSRRRKQLLQKRLAMGHKIDDHEEPVQGQTMQRT